MKRNRKSNRRYSRRFNRKFIIAWAYFDRTLLPFLVVFVPMGLVPVHQSGKLIALSFGGATVLFALYLLMGYLFRWTHYYCSIQNAYRLPMTPEDVEWGLIKKSDAYGIPAIFAVFGIAMLVLAFVF